VAAFGEIVHLKSHPEALGGVENPPGDTICWRNDGAWQDEFGDFKAIGCPSNPRWLIR